MTEEQEKMSKYELKKLIRELEDIRGRNTELVSLYIPADYDMSKISEFVTSEASEAENIKSKHTRKNVQAALDKIGRKVKEEQKPPETGVAFFSGNVSDREGRPEYKVWEVVPPQPIESRRYRCDKEFMLDPLREMVIDDEIYGLIAVDKNDAAIGTLQGSSVKTVHTLSSDVPGKTRAGGQCLVPETEVLMPDGSTKELGNVEIGEEVASVNPDTRRIVRSKVKDKWNNEKKVYKIQTDDGCIKASEDHEVFVGKDELGKMPVEDLNEGDTAWFVNLTSFDEDDSVLQQKVRNTRIESIEEKEERKTVDISVEQKNFVANNLLVHNSAQRFARHRKQMLKNFLTEVGEKAQQAFLDKARDDKLLGVVIGGPGWVKDKLAENHLHEELKEQIIANESLNYSGEEALEELVSKAEDAIKDSKALKEKELVNDFLEHLKEEDGKAEYGIEHVKTALDAGAVDTLLISADNNIVKAEYTCENGHEVVRWPSEDELEEKIECPECESKMKVEERKDLVEALGKKAEQMDSDIEIISSEHEEGKRLLNMGGVAAILRYRIR